MGFNHEYMQSPVCYRRKGTRLNHLNFYRAYPKIKTRKRTSSLATRKDELDTDGSSNKRDKKSRCKQNTLTRQEKKTAFPFSTPKRLLARSGSSEQQQKKKSDPSLQAPKHKGKTKKKTKNFLQHVRSRSFHISPLCLSSFHTFEPGLLNS
jgi:hypothetical protein